MPRPPAPSPPPAWWPGDLEGWERAVRRARRRAPAIRVEFDGLLVGCGADGTVVAADVLDPDDRGRGAAFSLRVLLGLAGVLVALEAGSWVHGWEAGVATPIGLVWVASAGFLALRDERPVRALPAEEAAAAVDRQAVLRRREERSDGWAPRTLPERGHRLLWALADGGPGAAGARSAHVALATGEDGGGAAGP